MPVKSMKPRGNPNYLNCFSYGEGCADVVRDRPSIDRAPVVDAEERKRGAARATLSRAMTGWIPGVVKTLVALAAGMKGWAYSPRARAAFRTARFRTARFRGARRHSAPARRRSVPPARRR